MKGWGVGSPLPTGGGVWAGRIFVEFLSKNCRVLCIFVVKNCLWPETGPWGLSRPPGGWRCKIRWVLII